MQVACKKKKPQGRKRKKTKSASHILRLSSNSYHTLFGPLLLANP